MFKMMFYEKGKRPVAHEIEPNETVYNAFDDKMYTRGRNNEILEIGSGSGSGSASSFRNKIANATFDVWQETPPRSVHVDAVASRVADLFTQQATTGQFTTIEGEIDGSRSLKLAVNTPPSSLAGNSNFWYAFDYKFEGQDLYHIAKTQGSVTISFKFRASKTGIYSIYLQHKSEDSYVSEFTVTTANTIEKYTVTIPLNAAWTTPLANDNNLGFRFGIAFLNESGYTTATLNTWETNGKKFCSANQINWSDTAGNYIEIAEPQLEEGTVATEFERPDYGTSLARVKRYYQKLGPAGHYGSSISSASVSALTWLFAVEFRARPTTKGTVNNKIENIQKDFIRIFATDGTRPFFSAGFSADARL